MCRAAGLPVPFWYLQVSVGRRNRSWTFRWELDGLYPQDLWHRWQLKNYSISRRASSIDAMQLPSDEASIGTPWDAYILRRDVSLPGTWQTTSRMRPRPWLMLRALRKNQVSCWQTLLLPIPVSIIPWFSPCSRTLSCSVFICRFQGSIYSASTTHVEFAGTTQGQFLMARGARQGCPANGFSFCNGLRPYLQMAPRDNYPKEPWQPGLLAAYPICLRWRPRCSRLVFSGLNDCAGTGVSFRGSHCWPQFDLSQMLLGSIWHWRTWIPVALVIRELRRIPWDANRCLCSNVCCSLRGVATSE